MKIRHDVKSYKNYSIFIPIVLVFVSFMLLRLFNPPALNNLVYSLKFTQMYEAFPTTEIADFSQSENWKGDFTRDTMRTFEGETGLNLFSVNGKKAEITLHKTFDSSNHDIFFLYVFAANQEMVKQVKTLRLTFTEEKNTAQYDINKLAVGWNLISVQKKDFTVSNKNSFNWKSVKAVSLTLQGKNDSFTQLTFNRIWSQKNLTYTSFALYAKKYTSLKTMAHRTYLHLASPEFIDTIFDKKITKRNSMYTVSFAPITFGSFALTFLQSKTGGDGYRFILDEERMDHWKLIATVQGNETILKKGKLKVNTAEKEAYMWLRIKKVGSSITLYSSIDGNSFEELGSVKDNRFSQGYIGIRSKGSFLLDSVSVHE